MVALADLGFKKDAIYEVIVCTYNQNGFSNAAPIGVVMQNLQQLTFVVYNSAATLKNLQVCTSATLNFTDDVDVFFHTALKDAALPVEWFEKSDKVNAPQLKPANAIIAVTIQDFIPLDAKRTKVTCEVNSISALKIYPKAYCRAVSAVLESIIHATRIKALCNDENEQAHVAKLVNLIKICNEIVNRSAPNSHYTELMLDLQKKIDTWMEK